MVAVIALKKIKTEITRGFFHCGRYCFSLITKNQAEKKDNFNNTHKKQTFGSYVWKIALFCNNERGGNHKIRAGAGCRFHLPAVYGKVRLPGHCWRFVHPPDCRMGKVSTRHDAALVTAALLDALSKYHAPDLVHSDQGSEYRSKEHMELLETANIEPSMSEKASPWQNGYTRNLSTRNSSLSWTIPARTKHWANWPKPAPIKSITTITSGSIPLWNARLWYSPKGHIKQKSVRRAKNNYQFSRKQEENTCLKNGCWTNTAINLRNIRDTAGLIKLR